MGIVGMMITLGGPGIKMVMRRTPNGAMKVITIGIAVITLGVHMIVGMMITLGGPGIKMVMRRTPNGAMMIMMMANTIAKTVTTRAETVTDKLGTDNLGV